MEGNVEVLISREKVEARISELAREIEKDYANKDLICVGLLKGSVMFMSDLIKEISMDLRIDFMKVSSYGGGTNSTGVVKILKDVDLDLTGKDVLIVEDIIDTGLTIVNVKDFLKQKNPNSIKVCTLLDKPSRRLVEVEGEYVGFEIPDEFVVGYGLDLDEKYRNIPFVGKFVKK
ncbi:hypoxanthine phosphoribosyltransferase [Fusobacterium sp.]|uniref:hypoxanthine phosphoribosyltransferase n=1 Tax=Fusobacterium sp. TaxID=68766 RepID=UPI00261E7471|nr:hypoxanthine phosphoribosyltransferase [Fusobacterium sp.]